MTTAWPIIVIVNKSAVSLQWYTRGFHINYARPVHNLLCWLANYKNMGQSQLNPYLNVCLVHKFKMPKPKRSVDSNSSKPSKKKQKWAQTSKESYTKQYLVIKRSDRDDSYYAFCEPCGSYFSIAASGIYNIGVHVNYSSLGDLSRHLTITGWGEGGSLKAIYRREKMFFFFC